MARKNYKVTEGVMKNNHQQNQMVRNAAKEVGISEQELSDEIHDRKKDWFERDYTYSELLEIAREIKKRNDKKRH